MENILFGLAALLFAFGFVSNIVLLVQQMVKRLSLQTKGISILGEVTQRSSGLGNGRYFLHYVFGDDQTLYRGKQQVDGKIFSAYQENTSISILYHRRNPNISMVGDVHANAQLLTCNTLFFILITLVFPPLILVWLVSAVYYFYLYR